MTSGALWNKILLFALPLAASSILQQLFNSVDTAVVGRFASSQALAAVGSNSSLISLMINLFIGISLGSNVVIARYIGEKSEKNIHAAIHTAILVAIISGFFVMIAGQFIAKPVLLLMGTPEDVIDLAVLYLRIYLLGMPFIMLYDFGSSILRSTGDSRRPLYCLIVAGVINTLLNLVLVIVFRLGVSGVAIATVISNIVSSSMVIYILTHESEPIKLELRQLKISVKELKKILVIGIPAGLQNAIFQIANLFVQAGVNSFDATMVAGNAAAANADALVYDVMTAFYTACGSFMGQNFGAGNRKRVRNSYLISLAYSFGIGMIMGLGLVLFGHQFLSLFSTDADVIEAGMIRLSIMGVCYGFSAFMDCTIMASRALGKSMIPMVIVIIGSCVFRVIWIYTVFAYFHTILSLYSLYIFSWGITAIAEIIYFVYIYKKRVC